MSTPWLVVVCFFAVCGFISTLLLFLGIFAGLRNSSRNDELKAQELEEFRATLEAEGQDFIDRHFQAVEQKEWESLARERARRQ